MSHFVIETSNDTIFALAGAVSDSERCEIARASVVWLNSAITNYLALYYCQVDYPFALYMLSIISLLIILFSAICLYSDRHFSLSMLCISRYLKLRPEVAGVTFLAFANGAPDFFTAFAGLEDTPRLVVGSAVGSSLFVSTIVLGSVILNARPINSIQENSNQAITEEVMQNVTDLGVNPSNDNADYEPSASPSPPPNQDVREFVSKDQHLKITNHFGYLKNSVFFLLAITLLFSLLFVERIGYWAPILFLLLYAIHISITIYVQVMRRSESLASIPHSTSSLHNSRSLLHSMRSSLMQVNYSLWSQFMENLKLITGWEEKSTIKKIFFALRFPIEIFGIISIPPMLSPEDLDFDSVYLPWCMYFYRIRLVLFPWFSSIFVVIAFHIEATLTLWISYVIIAAGLSIVLWLTSNWKRPPVYEPLIVLIAFATCIVWFYFISNELVSILNTLGIVCKISPSILGIAILAIGNTLGDLISNLVISRNGGFETALTACISAPSQNILLSLGVAILKTLVISNRDLEFGSDAPDSDLLFSFIVLVVILLAFPVTVIASNFKVPRNLGWVLIFTYLVYLPISVKLS